MVDRAARPGRLVVSLLAVAAVALAACSDDDDDSTPSTSTAPTTSEATDGTQPPEAEPTYTFGVLGPGDGQLSGLMTGQQRGVTLALDDINAAGGLLGGPATSIRVDEDDDEPIDTETETTGLIDRTDDTAEPVDPIGTAIDELVAQGANAILGPVSSASAATLAPLVAEQQLLACSASATAVSVTAGNSATSFFRTALRDDYTAAVVADRIVTVPEGESAPATVMILGRDDTYGTELTGDLSAQLTARGVAVDTMLYPSRRTDFEEQTTAVMAADPDLVVFVSYAEGPSLVAQLAAAGYPVDRMVGLDAFLDLDVAARTFPDDPTEADGFRVIGATGDRSIMQRIEEDVPAEGAGTAYSAQMYDCAITIALAAVAADTSDPAAVGAQIQAVTSGGRTCSTYAHCVQLLAAGEDIDYAGATGGLDIDANGDVSSARITTSTVIEGALVETATDEVDLIALRQQQLFAASVTTTQLQQALKLLGYFEGDITGVYDEATVAAVTALQHDLGLPETGQYDEATDAALRAKLGGRADALSTSISQLQVELTALGFYDGPIDGRYSAATIAAIQAFQTSLGVPPTGVLDPTTLRAIYTRGVQTGTPVTTPETTVAPPPPAPETTAAPAPPAPETTKPAPTIPPPTAPPTTEATTTTTELVVAEPTMWEALVADEQFSQFVAALRSVGFDDDLSQPIPEFTVFAPTNKAFDDMPPDQRAKWVDDLTQLPTLLAYHGVDPDAGVLGTAELMAAPPLVSIQGKPLTITVSGATIKVNDATVGPDVPASNGIVHAVDQVLIPPAS